MSWDRITGYMLLVVTLFSSTAGAFSLESSCYCGWGYWPIFALLVGVIAFAFAFYKIKLKKRASDQVGSSVTKNSELSDSSQKARQPHRKIEFTTSSIKDDYQLVLDHINLGLVNINSNLVIVSEYSEFLSEITGVSNSTGRSLDDVLFRVSDLSAEQIDLCHQAVKDAFNKRFPSMEMANLEIPIREFTVTLAGKSKIVAVSWVPIFKANYPNQLSSILLIVDDVTAIRVLEKNIESQNEKLIASSKITELWEVSAGVAHEINTPLAALLGRVSILMKGLAAGSKMSEDKKLENVLSIEKNAKRIAAIVRSLKRFSRDASEDPFISENILAIVEDSVSMVEGKVKELGVQLRLDLKTIENTCVQCRPSEVGQVIVNLINNAAYAVRGKTDPWVEVKGVLGPQKNVTIRVTDCGDGISEELQQKILEPFFTTKPVGEGTGLGLSISRKIAEDHGGALKYNPSTGHTTFELSLPVDTKAC